MTRRKFSLLVKPDFGFDFEIETRGDPESDEDLLNDIKYERLKEAMFARLTDLESQVRMGAIDNATLFAIVDSDEID